MSRLCTHLRQVIRRTEGVTPSGHGCVECLRLGEPWVHLRLCLSCGHVGCCDDSPNTHATKHAHATGHPVIRSYEPREDWGYCYPDDMMVDELPGFSGEVAHTHYSPPSYDSLGE